MTIDISKASRQNRLRKLLEGIDEHLQSLGTIQLARADRDRLTAGHGRSDGHGAGTEACAHDPDDHVVSRRTRQGGEGVRTSRSFA